MILVFDPDIPALIQRFRTGRQVTVYLRFWPTWPATELFPVRFSLGGFSRAHDSMSRGCLPARLIRARINPDPPIAARESRPWVCV